MIAMTFEQQAKLYEMIETAVITKRAVIFPPDIYPVLQVGRSSNGPTFTIPGLMWMDEQRNVYEVWMQMEFHSKDPCSPGLYVKGSRCPDGKSSGNIWMFKAENRYQTVL